MGQEGARGAGDDAGVGGPAAEGGGRIVAHEQGTHDQTEHGKAPDPDFVLAILRAAVSEALERKRRLGQYAVIWQDGRVVRLEASDIPPAPGGVESEGA